MRFDMDPIGAVDFHDHLPRQAGEEQTHVDLRDPWKPMYIHNLLRAQQLTRMEDCCIADPGTR